MLISLVGNIAAGKTTLAVFLKEQLGFSSRCLDSYREKWNSNETIDGEAIAQSKLIADLKKREANVILESSGTGKYYASYLKAFKEGHKGEEVIEILVDTPCIRCANQHKKRLDEGYKLPPYPWKFMGTIESSINWIGNDCAKFKRRDDVLKADTSNEDWKEDILAELLAKYPRLTEFVKTK